MILQLREQKIDFSIKTKEFTDYVYLTKGRSSHNTVMGTMNVCSWFDYLPRLYFLQSKRAWNFHLYPNLITTNISAYNNNFVSYHGKGKVL